jgi:membrane associated rhomboid family serine protease
VFPLKDDNPTQRFPALTLALIALNVVAYLLWQRGGLVLGSPTSEHFVCNLGDWAVFPYEVTHPGEQVATQGCPVPRASTWLTVFTSMFMHGGLLHLAGNMLFLWVFGNNVEDSMGPVRFMAFYLLGGIAATLLQTLMGPNATVPTVGASGAIAGVLGGYIVLYPRARVLTLILLVFIPIFLRLPAMIVLGLWFVEQLLFGYFDVNSGGESGGVAYFAHIGGFVFGLLAIRAFAGTRRPPPARPRPVYPGYGGRW